MAARKVSPREERRARERELTKLGEAREKLARLEPGGMPERPIEVESASVVEGAARSLGCVRGCEGESRVSKHEALTIDGERLRVVETNCPRCGHSRTVYLKLRNVQPN